MVRGIVCTKIGPWRDALTLCEDVEGLMDSRLEVDGDLIKVKVIASGLCFPDILVVEGKHMMPKPAPHVPCNEIAGEVIEVGEEVKRFKVGDKVFGTCFTGGLSSEALCRAEDCYAIPDGVDPNLVAGIEVNYGTSYHALVDVAEIKSGETLLILGASGGVGMSAIDIGKALGCKVVACASTQEKLDACKAAGADVVINYTSGPFKSLLKEAGVYGNVDVVYDPVGGEFSEPAIRSLAFGGRFIVIGFAAGGDTPKNAIPSIPLNLALLNERKIVGCLWGAWKMRFPDLNRANTENMVQMIKQGKLNPVVSKTYTFNDYMNAFEDMMSRKVVGKVIIQPIGGSPAKL
mmetsp:Transcript_8089/g.9745  ORF Transcript_8089/g.9745 Transcript_8089/m.9745 type:complete len:347 (-) Transcript_8089:571-1611(-)